jgi:hypothetical protein
VAGNSVLNGGGGQAILPGGEICSYNETAAAPNLTALGAIMQDWQIADSYVTRDSKPTAPDALLRASTALDDVGVVDDLFGDGGLDWFLAAGEDRICNQAFGLVVPYLLCR